MNIFQRHYAKLGKTPENNLGDHPRKTMEVQQMNGTETIAQTVANAVKARIIAYKALPTLGGVLEAQPDSRTVTVFHRNRIVATDTASRLRAELSATVKMQKAIKIEPLNTLYITI
jgi:hypothetical protein